MQRPGDGGGCQSKHIHISLQLFDLFLMAHTETLFLIDDQQAQILKLHIRRQYPVGADDDIHLALLQIRHRLFDFSGRSEAAHQIHPDGIILHPLDESSIVLLG